VGPRSARYAIVAALALSVTACQWLSPPVVGPRVGAARQIVGPGIVFTGASVDSAGRVTVSYEITNAGKPVTGAAAAALDPAFTLAALGSEPVTGLRAWRSLLLTGTERIPVLPVAGPGTPAGPSTVLQDSPQPGPDVGGVVTELGDGRFSYAYSASVAPFGTAETLRAGVFLRGTKGSPITTATLDFVPAGGTPSSRELVRDESCAACHGTLRAHGGSRHGTRICVTCHTYQHADADTIDPAALSGLATGAATPQTNPNPLELGRLVHRIHRGKNLPTLYDTRGSIPAPSLPTGQLALPFAPGQNAPVPWRKFSVVGEHGAETVYGQIVQRIDNAQSPRTLARGVTFPREVRDCDACHAGAADAATAMRSEISRRTCQGCHPDVWYGAGTPDAAHLPHPGGPQADDSACPTCHVSTATTPAKYVDIREAHVPIIASPRMNRPALQIVEVRDARPDMSPTVVFTLTDREGTIDSLFAPTPLADPTSPLTRDHFSWFEITIAGPVSPDFRSYGANGPIGEFIGACWTGETTCSQPVGQAVFDPSSGRFSYTFQSKLPNWATGTWIVGLDTRRSGTTAFYDATTDRFSWPFTGEYVVEPADTAIAWVDVDAGGTAAGSPVPRRAIVDLQKCDGCHGRLAYHGGMRNRVEYCPACHTPERTDWHKRVLLAPGPGGNVSPAATYDAVEERALHFKVMIHRIHTGSHRGSAELSGLGSAVTSYGSWGILRFRDVGEFPGDLADCTLCHLAATHRPESVPADAPPTVANETASVWHAGSVAHAPGEPTVPPITAACTGCHATSTAMAHAAGHAPGGREQCPSCHGLQGSVATDRMHGVPYELP
jgi:OmcA/MtrC family decaheme c-type cytochrome